MEFVIKMQTLKQYLNEHYINLLPGDEDKKREHAEHLHNMLQKAYADQGGIHGTGFSSPEDMVKHIPMWKLTRKNGKIVSAAFYKDKEGRKKVAMASDGSEEGKAGLSHIIKSDLERNNSYSEVSGKSLSFHKKHIKDFHKFLMKREDVAKVSKDPIGIPHDDDPEVKRHPELKDHMYTRDIGGVQHTKVMIGKPGVPITPRK